MLGYVCSRHVLADEPFVTDPLFCILGGIESDLLFARIDDVCDLEIQHEVKLKQTIWLAVTWDCQLCLMAVTNFGKNQLFVVHYLWTKRKFLVIFSYWLTTPRRLSLIPTYILNTVTSADDDLRENLVTILLDLLPPPGVQFSDKINCKIPKAIRQKLQLQITPSNTY